MQTSNKNVNNSKTLLFYHFQWSNVVCYAVICLCVWAWVRTHARKSFSSWSKFRMEYRLNTNNKGESLNWNVWPINPKCIFDSDRHCVVDNNHHNKVNEKSRRSRGEVKVGKLNNNYKDTESNVRLKAFSVGVIINRSIWFFFFRFEKPILYDLT